MMEPLDIDVVRQIFEEKDKYNTRASNYNGELRRKKNRISQIKLEIQELRRELHEAEEERSRLSDCFHAYEAQKKNQHILDASCVAKLVKIAKSLPEGSVIKIESLCDAELFCKWKGVVKDALTASPLIVASVSEEQSKKMNSLFSGAGVSAVREHLQLPHPRPPSPYSSGWLRERFNNRYDVGNWLATKD